MPFIKKLSLIKRIKTRIKRYMICITYARRRNTIQGNSVYFLSSNEFNNRKLMQLIYYFRALGYNCYLDYSFRQCLKNITRGINVLPLQGVFPINEKINNFSIIISPNKQALDAFSSSELKIHLNYLETKDGASSIKNVTETDFYYPIGIAPNLLNHSVETEMLKRAFNADRKIGAIFAGALHCKKDGHTRRYSRDAINKEFNINNRYETFFAIADQVSKEYVYLPNSLEMFMHDMEAGHLKNKIVLIDRNVFSIPHDKYFDVLLNSNFHIHMAGIYYPFCHNQIESMLAGCIPITQFARFFIPAFTNELNALLFTTLGELIVLLNDVMSEKYTNSIDAMRKEIISYYRSYCGVESFNNKLSHLLKNKIPYTNLWVPRRSSD